MKIVDWEKLWEMSYLYNRNMERKEPGIEYWDERADDYSDGATSNDYEYGRRVLEVLTRYALIDSNSNVLEIGPGPGTFAIPFGKKVKKVTVVEPSQGMIKYLKQNAEKEGVSNIEVINKKWQDVNDSEVTKKFDLVICSHVLWFFKDIWKQLERMEKASKGFCVVAQGTGWKKGMNDLWNMVLGDQKMHDWSNYTIIFNILYNRKRLPSVRIINYRIVRTPEKWIKSRELCFDRYTKLTPDKKRMIRDYILNNSEDGKFKTDAQAAVIWWHAQEDWG